MGVFFVNTCLPHLRIGSVGNRQALSVRRRRLSVVALAGRSIPKEKKHDDFGLEQLGFVEVGLVLGPHGFRGGAKVKSLSDFPEQRLGERNSLRHLKAPDRLYPRPIKLIRGAKAAQKDTWIVFLDGVATAEDVQALRGSRICVKIDEKPKMKNGDYYVRDLIGLKVLLYGSGLEVGQVNDIYNFDELQRHIRNPAKKGHDLLEVMMDGEEDNLVLIPFVKQIVPVVNIQSGEVLIDPPEGLLDIAKVNVLRKRAAPRLFLQPAADNSPRSNSVVESQKEEEEKETS